MKKSLSIIIMGPLMLCFGPGRNLHNIENSIEVNGNKEKNSIQLFLCGDVMTGRGIDQALPYSVDPELYETYVKDARDYLLLAERVNGNIPEPVSYEYIWGDALNVLIKRKPDLKLINLETSITTNDEPWPGKGIHYRMHPENIRLLEVAGINHCSLANNHLLDWSRAGLIETMKTLKESSIAFSGAGKNEKKAGKASIFNMDAGRVLVFSYGIQNSGIPSSWAAGKNHSGINFLAGTGNEELKSIKNQVESSRIEGDIIILSIHWGGNWGYNIPSAHKDFAHRLIDEAGVDLIFGHSSHHPMGIEVYKEKLIIYGAGDLINDYEGISGHEQYRSELSLMYFARIRFGTGKISSLELVPMVMNKFMLNKAGSKDIKWLQKTLNRECEKLRTGLKTAENNSLLLEW